MRLLMLTEVSLLPKQPVEVSIQRPPRTLNSKASQSSQFKGISELTSQNPPRALNSKASRGPNSKASRTLNSKAAIALVSGLLNLLSPFSKNERKIPGATYEPCLSGISCCVYYSNLWGVLCACVVLPGRRTKTSGGLLGLTELCFIFKQLGTQTLIVEKSHCWHLSGSHVSGWSDCLCFFSPALFSTQWEVDRQL